ncbi:MAG TPA: fasciclin domain-containing protein [Gammaproteobacteria bacterium]|nr:fasciclin domain-containing protein [Gammaproteobacteria bacterium]
MFNFRNRRHPLAIVAALLTIVFLMPAMADEAATKPANVMATLQQSGKFTTFVRLVNAAGMARSLRSGDYTVFAPTDDAFAKLPAGTVDNWLKPANKAELVSLVKYHIVPRSLPSSMFSKTVSPMHDAETMDQRHLAFTQDTQGITVNGTAKVVEADIKASNGVIHAIDTVLTPPSR